MSGTPRLTTERAALTDGVLAGGGVTGGSRLGQQQHSPECSLRAGARPQARRESPEPLLSLS